MFTKQIVSKRGIGEHWKITSRELRPLSQQPRLSTTLASRKASAETITSRVIAHVARIANGATMGSPHLVKVVAATVRVVAHNVHEVVAARKAAIVLTGRPAKEKAEAKAKVKEAAGPR